MRLDAEVLIVGGGIAGICAARELARRGHNCLILEGRARLGGRIFTRALPGSPAPAELGAEFVHGNPSETLKLIDEFKIASYDIPDEHLLATRGKLSRTDDFWERIGPALSGRPKGRRDLSFGEFARTIRMRPADRALARMFVEGFHAADPDLLSQCALSAETQAADEIDGTRACRVWNGYGALVEALWGSIPLPRCRVILRHEVHKVRWNEGHVELNGGSSRPYRGRAAIFTAPPEPLKRIRFTPDIPDKWDALGFLRSGSVVKIVLRFDKVFWEKALGRHMGFIHATNERFFPTWWSASPFRCPSLTGWTGGPAAEELTHCSLGEVLEEALRTLGHLVGKKPSQLAAEAICVGFHDWQTDRFSLGAYGYLREGGQGAPERLARPVKNTLFFAGESTEGAGLGGTVESAIRSGLRAARQYRR
jgi:monoamine oxidase